jgi:hypothetical protein
MVERGSGQNKKNGLKGEGITISAKVLGHCGCAGLGVICPPPDPDPPHNQRVGGIFDPQPQEDQR